MTVVTRFAPSPTGYLHVGGARTALFCCLYARHCGGRFILRVEDTDRERSTDDAVQVILEGMRWLGLDCDDGPFYQSKRSALYSSYLERLLDSGHAYRCTCTREELDAMREEQCGRGETPRYDRRCREGATPRPGIQPVVRFKNPLEGDTRVEDQILGPMVFANTQLDDFIIARSDGTPTYNFVVAVDDHEMGVTHVIRGNDHVNNTPKQLNVLRALGVQLPHYAHVPMIMGADGKKLSKRHGAVSVMQFRDEGYLPDALVNYLARLGWSHGDQEIFSRAELVEAFDIADVNKGASVFDMDKLGWLNQHYIKQAEASALTAPLAQQLEALGIDPAGGPDLAQVVEVQRERSTTLVEMARKSEFAFRAPQIFDEKAVRKHMTPEAIPALLALADRLQALPQWHADVLEGVVREIAEARGLKMGKLAQPLRVALTGTAASPSIDQTLLLVGRDGCLSRIRHAAAVLGTAEP